MPRGLGRPWSPVLIYVALSSLWVGTQLLLVLALYTDSLYSSLNILSIQTAKQTFFILNYARFIIPLVGTQFGSLDHV